ncbi:uncharacterized protein DSM5745_00747 [Aspergillus mulundensis]|uniref:Uncharacterized protein n=1 Tax=Aspergillus mulundensis TaxID=1810919 RepID=A0A3D8T4E6_9EURO|nr:hypothetical protein DSM5745_00747 [Aspergillus mulundensis]RDW93425.1 hypothetical protein DSM5745_00747 [Aspergillus mulundensis]
MSTTTPRRVGESSWTDEEKQRLHRLRTTGNTKGMPWTAFHKLNHFPNHTDAAVQMQFYRMTSMTISARKRRERGSSGDTTPAKRPAMDGNGSSAKHQDPRVFHETDSESSEDEGDIYDNPGTAKSATSAKSNGMNSLAGIGGGGSRPTGQGASQSPSTQTLSSHSHLQNAIQHTQSAVATVPARKAVEPVRSSFTPVNQTAPLQTVHRRQSAPLTGTAPTQSPPANLDHQNLPESSRATPNQDPNLERPPQSAVSTSPQQFLNSRPATEGEQRSKPLEWRQEEEEQAITRRWLTQLNKDGEELISRLKSCLKNAQQAAQVQNEELAAECNELRDKLAAETKEKEGYVKEIGQLKAEVKRMEEEQVLMEAAMKKMEEEQVKILEDKKRITGVCKTLEELVGFIKH